MSLFRVGLLLLPLLLSACSSPIFQKTTPKQGEQTTEIKAVKPNNTADKVETKDTNTADTAAVVSDHKEQKEKLSNLLQSAKQQYDDLKIRSGEAPLIPSINMSELNSNKALESAIQSIRAYNSNIAAKLAGLDSLVEKRKAAPEKGDMLKIFIHKANIRIASSNFTTQPLIGQWVRGESRVVRLKDSLLFDTKHSEDIKVTYSNSYQILVNDQVISVVNPYREKNTAPFDVDATEKNGNIEGELDYTIITNSQ